MPINVAIILAGGVGSRLNSSIPKQFQKLMNNRIIDYSVKKFLQNNKISNVIIVCHKNWIEVIKKEYPKCIVIKGGLTRQESSFIGIMACPENIDNVLIHDSARPFVTENMINDSIEMLKQYDAVNISVPSSDTVINVKNNIINLVLDRREIYLSQTPQSFKYDIILKAHNKSNGNTASDDIQLVRDLNVECYNIIGSRDNIKITNPLDIKIAENLIVKKINGDIC